MCTPLPVSALRYAGSVATSVLPSPVFISAILPLCSTMPPSICTSKWRMRSVRLEASRTTANASGSSSSSVAPSACRFFNSSVFARSASSDSFSSAGSSALIVCDGVRVLLEQALVAAAEDARRQAPESLEELAQGFHGWRRKPLILLEKPRTTWRAVCAAAGAEVTRNLAGFCAAPRKRTSKCRCGPVERPVVPTSPIFRPRCTRSPSRTTIFEVCA